MPENPEELERPTAAVDAEAFAELFFHPRKNHQKIWIQMSRIVTVAAREIRGRTANDLDEWKAEALAHAVEQIKNYDPKRRTAFFYFYQVIQKRLLACCARPRHVFLGESEDGMCFHQLEGLSRRAEEKELSSVNFPNNWRSFRLTCSRDRFLADKFFRVSYRRAKEQMNQTESEPERAAIAVILATIKQVRRSLLG
jgi:hypothetical protein